MNIRDILKMLILQWRWTRNTRCKYVTVTIDMRGGSLCEIMDRDGESITFEEFQHQHTGGALK